MVAGQSFDYDAYGNRIGATTPATRLLYAGEMLDASSGWYYNRARFYNPAVGRFNSLDPYSGNVYDPLSLHKYIYCHGNPANGTDPTGKENLITTMAWVGLRARIMVGMISPVMVQLPRVTQQLQRAMVVARAQVNWMTTYSMQAGRSAEIAVQRVFQIAQENTQVARTLANQQTRVFDFLTSKGFMEIKNVQYLSCTQQLKDMAQLASSEGLIIVCRVGSVISGPMLEYAAKNGIIILPIL
jgi:RHS repeat-associated protein